jgi:RimJ/RimL family protein N-acetyltransferase
VIRDLHVRIGTPYQWPSASRTDEDWERWLAEPQRRYRLIEYRGEVAGAADFEPQPGGAVEITTFGLLPEFVGKGLGGYALTLVVADAWTLPGARRVWLHTSTLDHPNALPNYLRRGFRSFSRRA